VLAHSDSAVALKTANAIRLAASAMARKSYSLNGGCQLCVNWLGFWLKAFDRREGDA
jgi:hypothetical protein